MQHISITGSGSFIGTHLINCLALYEDVHISCLSRRNSKGTDVPQGSIIFQTGDLLERGSLNNFAQKGGTVINLAYLHNASTEDNLTAMRNLLDHCGKVGIRRFIHCSTANVIGNSAVVKVTEETICSPITAYEKTKFLLEKLLIEQSKGCFEYIIIRPTAVFGVGGKNLLKTISDIRNGNSLLNYLRLCVFNKRNMHLVCVENVIAAFMFIIDNTSIADEIFIVSDDDSAGNNYSDIAKIVTSIFEFGNSLLPPVYLPLFFLSYLLKLTGRSDRTPQRVYDCSKLKRFGYRRPVNFEKSIRDYVYNYKLQLCC